MSLPETCPFCGAGGELKNPEKWVGFTCMTTIHAGQDERRMQSLTCAGLERKRLDARLAALEAENKVLRDRVAELEAENKHLTQLLDGYRVHADAHRALLDKYDAERNGWLDVVGKASRAIDLFAKLARDLEQAKADRARASMDARNPLLEELAKLEPRCKRLEEAGNMIVDEYMVVEPEKSAWQQAKEAKP